MLERFWEQHALRWALLSPVFMALGAAIYFSLHDEPTWLSLGAGALICLCGGYLARRARAGVMLMVIGGLSWGLAGGMAGKLRVSMTHAPRLIEAVGPTSIEGVLDRIDPGGSGNRLKIRVSSIAGLTHSEAPEFIRITQRDDTQIEPGRPIRCYAILSPPPPPGAPGDYDFQRQAWFQKLGGVGFVLGKCEPASLDASQAGWRGRASDLIHAVRRRIALHVRQAAGERAGGIAAAIVAGDRSFLSQQDMDALRHAGLAHLLAISGLHMGLAGGVFFFGLRWGWLLFEPLALRIPAHKVAAVGAWATCTGYLVLSGASVATQRAYIMTAVAFAAILLDRPALTFRSLSIAMVVVISLQPETVVTPGFQMSFAATAALIALYEVWPRRLSNRGTRGLLQRWSGWLASLAATSVVASLATAPFSAFHFGRVPLMSIPANLAAMPIISIWSAPSAALAVTFSPIGLSEPFLASLGRSLEVVIQIAEFAASADQLTDSRQLDARIFLILICALITGVTLKGKYKSVMAAPLLGAGVLYFSSPEPQVLISRNGMVYAKTVAGWQSWNADQNGARSLTPLQIKGEVTASKCSPEHCEFRLANGLYLLEIQSAARLCEREEIASDCPEVILRRGGAVVLETVLSRKFLQGGVAIDVRDDMQRVRRLPDWSEKRRPWW